MCATSHYAGCQESGVPAPRAGRGPAHKPPYRLLRRAGSYRRL